MTREETVKVLAVLRGAYPQFYRGISKKEALDTVNLWAEMFREESYGLVSSAVKALIAVKEDSYPPSIGAVKARIRQITQPQEMTEGEAWGLVQNALSRSLYNSVEEYSKLPPILQRLVGSPNQLREWAMMDLETVQSVVSSNVQRSYRARAKSQREYDALPEDVKAAISATAEKLALEC